MDSKSVAFYAVIFYTLVTINDHALASESTTPISTTVADTCDLSVASCSDGATGGSSEKSGSVMLNLIKEESDHTIKDAVVLTVASNETDGYERFVRSAKVYGIFDNLKVLGLNKVWKGGNMQGAGGGYKLNLLRNEIMEYKDRDDKIVLFTDSYDVIFIAGLDEIINKFKSFDARILISAEVFCWPDKSLASKYPAVARGVPYVNSGAFIGYASDIYKMLSAAEIKDTEDDQLFLTHRYIDQEFREKHKIKLDHKSEIFQNLNGATADIELQFVDGNASLQNTAYETFPLILHGNGPSKLTLNTLGNYVAKSWNEIDGCLSCKDNTIELPEDKLESWPSVVMALFVDSPTPFFEEFLHQINLLSYPKSKIYLFVYVGIAWHEQSMETFIEKHGKQYAGVKKILPEDNIGDGKARSLAMDYCLLKDCAFLFHVDSLARLENPHTLSLLIEQNRSIVAPMLVRLGNYWSNFWTAVAENGYYARGFDYEKIVDNLRQGLWNVPYINNCYLINATVIKNPKTKPTYEKNERDIDMAFAESNRANGVFMYVSNRLEFGHLVNPDDFDTSLTNPDMFEIFNNAHEWEKRYIHENYSAVFKPGAVPIQPCPDVYWFPIVTERFTKELVELVEDYGKWSSGSNEDSRIEGGYENVPTRDIHMSQVSYDKHWHKFLKAYVQPLQELVFLGYMNDPPKALLNFVVRYKPDEQPSLRPHHDASTYTINIALNRAGIDYEGGGCRFVRYNCSVTDTKRGWMLMHPGRLTHYHEGLRVTRGTRYIMISFVDP